jgi:hypothetical protein
MHSLLDEAELLRGAPDGLPLGTDTGSLATGTLVGLDGRLAQVTVAGSDPVWVPALPAIYSAGGQVRLLRSPLDGGRISLCLCPLVDADVIVSGEVTNINATDGVMTVTTLGGSHTLPYNAGTYTVGTMVHVLRDAQKYGKPVHVLGTQGNYVAPTIPAPPDAGTGNPAQLVAREILIPAQWSGSWRSAFSKWAGWQPDRFGGPSTLYQGNAYGSGPMTGLATYGDQILGLNAVQITSMRVAVFRSDTSSSAALAPVLQPSPNGSQPAGAPSTGGDTATGPGLTPGASALVDLPSSVFEAFRTGSSKGLAMVGSSYAAFLGTSRADGMSIRLQYTVLA